MSYEIDAFVGNIHTLERWRGCLGVVVVFRLLADIALVPLTPDLLQDIGGHLNLGDRSEEELTNAWCATETTGTAIAVISANYFGGQGDQSATVWSDGKVVASKVDINSALRVLGVRRTRGNDEFDTVGLGRFRKTEAWVDAARAQKENADSP